MYLNFHVVEQCLNENRDIARNSFEALRAIFLTFGSYRDRTHREEDYK